MDFEPHEHARRDDPHTSHATAASVSYKKDALRVLAAYVDAGEITDHEAYRRAGMDPTGARQRCSDLRAKGLIVPTGKVGKSPAGKPARLCEITINGLLVHQGLDPAPAPVLDDARAAEVALGDSRSPHALVDANERADVPLHPPEPELPEPIQTSLFEVS